MKKITSLLLIAGLLFATLFFGGCNASKEVPDDVLARFVEDSKYYDTDYALSWTADHSFSKSSNIDTVRITLTAESTYGSYTTTTLALYEYNRASDLWTLVEADEWSERVYTLNNNILRNWKIGSYLDDNKSYSITVADYSGDHITVDYSIKEDVYGGIYAGNVVCKATGSCTAEINRNYFEIPITLPEHFVAKDSIVDDPSKTIELTVYFSIDEGLSSAIFNSQLFYVE